MVSVTENGAAGAAPSPARIVVAIGGIYVAQSVIGGVVFKGLPAVMRQNGASLNDIAIILLTVLPWSFKFLWSPAIERYRSPRIGVRRSRRVIALFGAFAVCAVVACALIGPQALGPLMIAMMVASFSSATVDIACDGHAVESLSEKDRGWGNSAQVGGAYLGSAIGGGLFLVLIDQVGWQPAALVMAVVLIGLGLPFLTMRDGARSARPDHPPQSLKTALKRPEVRSGLVLVGLYVLGQKWAMGLLTPFLVDSGMSLSTLGALSGVGITGVGLGAALCGGYIVRRFGAFRVMSLTLVLQAAAMGGLALYAQLGLTGHVPLVLLTLLSSAALAAGFVALYAELMGRASLDQAGVDFTLFQSMDAIVSVIGWQLFGSFGDGLGFAACFAISAVLGLIVLAIMPMVARGSSALAGQSDQRA